METTQDLDLDSEIQTDGRPPIREGGSLNIKKLTRQHFHAFMESDWSDRDVARLFNNDQRRIDAFQSLAPESQTVLSNIYVRGNYVPPAPAKKGWQAVIDDTTGKPLMIPANTAFRIINYGGSICPGLGWPNYKP